jgi:hypothetical protein
MHRPASQANPGEQIGAQLAQAASAGGAAVAAMAEVGEASPRTATVAEMNIPAPSGLIPSLNP